MPNLSPSVTIHPPHFSWPPISKEIENAVVHQLYETISIYDRSGIFERFENKFSSYHGLSYSLLTNSGTMALFSLFDAIGIGPNDDVLCPDYTFFATVTPLVYLGARPIFCDCDKNGNIDPDELPRVLTPRTKAVVVTHMWGVPCDMDPIVDFCQRKGLRLLEDCSHAHGATYRNRKVGTFGDGAAWSLQGQKLVTGGEGGILSTNDKEIYFRALLAGHYNKRCKSEIPNDHHLAQFRVTGFGLKLRAHPIAIAIAEVLFDNLQNYLSVKKDMAGRLIQAISGFPFFRLPDVLEREPSWYAFPIWCKSEDIAIQIHQQMVSKGAVEMDRPTSTGSLCVLPLFRQLATARPRSYKRSFSQGPLKNSSHASKTTLKLPVPWEYSQEPLWNEYAETLKGIAKGIDQ